MATHVAFRKMSTGEIKTVKVGWSWTLFLFGPLLGIPFWIRKYYPAAAMMVIWNVACIALSSAGADTLIRGASIGLAVMLGLRGNQETAKYYLKQGWELAEPDAEETLDAQRKWALA